jgi:hypothetical protein
MLSAAKRTCARKPASPVSDRRSELLKRHGQIEHQTPGRGHAPYNVVATMLLGELAKHVPELRAARPTENGNDGPSAAPHQPGFLEGRSSGHLRGILGG